jgi:hypothetical protein
MIKTQSQYEFSPYTELTVTLNHKNLYSIHVQCKCKASSNSPDYILILCKQHPCQWPSTEQSMSKITLWTSKETFFLIDGEWTIQAKKRLIKTSSALIWCFINYYSKFVQCKYEQIKIPIFSFPFLS